MTVSETEIPPALPGPLPAPLPVPPRAAEVDLQAVFARMLRRTTLLDRAREKQARAAHDAQRDLLVVLVELYDDLSALGESVRVQSGREDVGIGAMRRKVLGRLARAGVRQMRLDGRLADPRAAEIVGSEPRPGLEADTVVQTVSEGFWWGEEVLRPARVVVATSTWAPAPQPAAAPGEAADDADADVDVDVENVAEEVAEAEDVQDAEEGGGGDGTGPGGGEVAQERD